MKKLPWTVSTVERMLTMGVNQTLYSVITGSTNNTWPTPVAARSKGWVCGRLSAGIRGSNPAGVTDICLL